MADKKISALTAATTPLAGTEVLPIVQGGATVKATVASLTGAGNYPGLFTTLTATEGATLKADSTGAILKLERTGTSAGSGYIGADVNYAFQTFNSDFSGLRQFKITQTTPTDAATLSSSGLTLTGNLVINTSGNGIDFSATPGTGTSELLADYEEGTWTPAFGAFAGAFTSLTYSVQDGKYTKVGNQVTAYFSIVVTAVTTGTAATILLITGLPFTPVSGVCLTTYQSNFLTQGPDFGQFYGSGSNMLLRFKSLTSSINVDPTQVTNTTELQGSVTYFV
jgi:hypothetical protein